MQRALFRVLLILACLSGIVGIKSANAAPLLFTINTAALGGQSGKLAFNFIGTDFNTATISQFTTDGVIGAPGAMGEVTGNLPGTTALTTGVFLFNEASLDLTFGSTLSFIVNLTGNAPGGLPDALSLFFLDGSTGMSMFPTSDPSGADALFLWSVDGSPMGELDFYAANGVSISAVPVDVELPEPSTLWLVLPALALAALRARRAQLQRLAAAFGIVALSGMAIGAQAADLGGQVSVSKGGLVLNRSTDTFDSLVTVTNTSSTPIGAPLLLTIKNITAPGVSVYNSSSRDAQDNAQVAATLNLGVLQPGAKVAVPVRFVNRDRIGFDFKVAVSGELLDSASTAPLTVSVHAFSGDDENPVGASAGAGVKLYIDGVLRGVTDATGKASFLAPLDASSLSARRPPSDVGTAELNLNAGEANTATVVLSDDGEVYADAQLRIDQVRNLLLPNTFAAFSMRFVQPGESTAKVVDLALVELFDSIGNSQGDITSMFTLGSDGVIRAANVSSLRSFLANRQGKQTLRVTAIDADHNVYLGNASFHIARHQVSGHFSAPASFPGLELGGIRIVGKLLNTDIVVETVSNADGSFAFPNLPNGNLSYSSETFQNERFYYGSGTVSLTGATSITVPLLSAADSGPAAMAMVSAAVAEQSAKEGAPSQRRPEDLDKQPVWPALPGDGMKGALATAATPTSATVTVTAAAQNAAITQTATLNVPKGTTKVTLTYNVGTAEYPTYVTQQSIYNDVWGIKLFAGSQGSQIFEITRQVNSQLTQAPVWQSNGTTGLIEQSFDVTALAKDNDIELTLTAFATNIGDSALATTVNAKVEAGSKLTINSFSALPTGWTAHDTNVFSMPASGDNNHFHRKMRLNITKPDDATISNLKVEVLAGGATSTSLDEGPGANVTTPNASTVNSVVTFKTNASTLNGVPPPSSTIQYRYTLKATAGDGSELETSKTDTANRRGLWRMPAGFARYSTREPGGDDWASRRTYNWMAANSNLLTAINDVSGEHGKDLGHATHARGSDIDMYHFYRFNGALAASGTSNYNMLVARVLDLPKQNSANPAQQAIGQAAANEIRAWIAASRTGIDNLAAQAAVLQVGYIRGGPNAAGIAGANWGQTLLTTGRVTVNGVLFDLGTGTWTNAKYHAWANHHHHVHVTLNAGD